MVKIESVCVAGGGSAGWLAALYFKKAFPYINVTVVEDPASLPIIAGESCTIPFVELLEYLDIDFFLWIKITKAVPKLGGMFVNWDTDSSKFVQPLFSRYLNRWLYENPEFGEKNDYLKSIIVNNINLSDLVPAGQLIKSKKVPWTKDGNMVLKPMYHFDSRGNAAYLKDLGIKRGIKLVEQKIVSYEISDIGIENLILDHTKLRADFYIDCTGFKQLLLKDALNNQFVNCSNFISNSSVIAWWDESDHLPYTEMTAMDYGWRFNVSLQDRSGNGYIYDGSSISKDQALTEIESKIGKRIDPIASMTWKPDISFEPWSKNVLALGLSNGFLEPLGSPGHTMIALQLKLLDTVLNGYFSTIIEKRYNEIYKGYVTDTLDFITLHYLGKNKDNQFWSNKKNNLPDSLTEKISELREGIFDNSKFPVYSIENYLAVLQALNLIDKRKISCFLNNREKNLIKKSLDEFNTIKNEIQMVTDSCITINQWMKIYG